VTKRRSDLLTAICGIIGPAILVTSFLINPAPPADYTTDQLRDFAIRHHNGIVLGGWLQGMGSLLIVLFTLALVHLANATHRLAGWITLLAGASILMVSLVEITFYLGAVKATESGDAASALASNNLIKAVQHVFLIAPALLLPLGFVLLGSNVLPRAFAYLSLAMGAALQVLGLLGLFNVLQPVIDILLIVQSFWFVAAAVALLVRGSEATATTARPLSVPLEDTESRTRSQSGGSGPI
jgi:hypothetical protein